jgi:hypothetical protein
VTFGGIKFLQTLQAIFKLTEFPTVLSGVVEDCHCLTRENLAFIIFTGIFHIRLCNVAFAMR